MGASVGPVFMTVITVATFAVTAFATGNFLACGHSEVVDFGTVGIIPATMATELAT